MATFASILAVLLAAGCVGPRPSQPWSAELEGALTWLSRNDVAVPGDTGSRFALDSLIGTGPEETARLQVAYAPAARHEWRALAAPLSIAGEDVLAVPVDFAGTSFAAGPSTHASYRFDSYRLTWRYLVHESDEFDLRLGITGKIRDAEIELRQGALRGRKTDLGFVPLLHAAGVWRLNPDWRLVVDVDAAWAPQGRAIDATLQVRRMLGANTDIGLGYRTIEGGADNDAVYTFAWIHQAVLSVGVRF